MVTLRRVDTVMTGVPGTPYYNSLYFTLVSSVTAVEMCNMVREFWEGCLAFSDNALTATVQSEVAQVEDTTGDIVGFEQGATSIAVGGSTQPSFPMATQALIRARTDTVAGGRRIQGKVFIPAIAGAAPTPAPDGDLVAFYNQAATFLITESSSLGPWRIYSRKNGTSAVVTSASAWNQWSVLRSRRD